MCETSLRFFYGVFSLASWTSKMTFFDNWAGLFESAGWSILNVWETMRGKPYMQDRNFHYFLRGRWEFSALRLSILLQIRLFTSELLFYTETNPECENAAEGICLLSGFVNTVRGVCSFCRLPCWQQRLFHVSPWGRSMEGGHQGMDWHEEPAFRLNVLVLPQVPVCSHNDNSFEVVISGVMPIPEGGCDAWAGLRCRYSCLFIQCFL